MTFSASGKLFGGALTITGAVTIAAGATNVFDLTSGSEVGGSNDLVVVGGTLTLNNSRIVVQASPMLQTAAPYRLFNYSGTLSGTFNPTVTSPNSSP